MVVLVELREEDLVTDESLPFVMDSSDPRSLSGCSGWYKDLLVLRLVENSSSTVRRSRWGEEDRRSLTFSGFLVFVFMVELLLPAGSCSGWYKDLLLLFVKNSSGLEPTGCLDEGSSEPLDGWYIDFLVPPVSAVSSDCLDLLRESCCSGRCKSLLVRRLRVTGGSGSRSSCLSDLYTDLLALLLTVDSSGCTGCG